MRVALQFLLAEAYSTLGKWDKVKSIYNGLFLMNSFGHMSEACAIYTGYSRALYETGEYDKAVELGNKAIEKLRCETGVHKYVALSQKAKGDIDGAKLTMSRAILYEYHWDKDNLQMNKQLLRELKEL